MHQQTTTHPASTSPDFLSSPAPPPPDLIDLYKTADAGATAALLGKLSIERAFASKLDDVRSGAFPGCGLLGGERTRQLQEGRLLAARFVCLPGVPAGSLNQTAGCSPHDPPPPLRPRPAAIQQRLAASLREYRMLHMRGAGGLSPNSLVLPERLKAMPLLCLGLVKTAALRGSGRDVNSDERTAVGHTMMAGGVPENLALIYPACYPVHELAGGWLGGGGVGGAGVGVGGTAGLGVAAGWSGT